MIEYIKKFQICIRWYMELEDGCLAEQGICWNLKRKGTEKLVNTHGGKIITYSFDSDL